MKQLTVSLLSTGLYLVMAACTNNAPKEVTREIPPSPMAIATAEDVSTSTETSKSATWTYTENKDEMTDQMTYFAERTSTNSVDLEFPYEGGTWLTILIRKMGGRNEVLLRINKGQFSSSYSHSVRIKYDDKELKTYGYNSSSDGSSDYIFLDGSSGIIKKLKTAKTLKIQSQLFQAGQTVFEFNVEGFEWNH